MNSNYTEKGLIERKKHLKVDRILLVVFCILVIVAIVVMINNMIKEARIKKKEQERIMELQQIEQNRIAEEKRIEEEAKQKELENRKKRYTKLNEDELNKFSKIYGHSDIKRVFLTFDDGPTNSVTPFILDLLKQEGIKANFFVLGLRAEQNPSLVKREYDEGHFVGNHGYSHKYSAIYESVQTVFDEYNKTNDLIKKAVQDENYNSIVFRFPGGLAGGKYSDIKKEAAKELKENGIANVDWNALTKDAEGAKTKESILENFYNTVQDKTSIVLLMHDAADKILTYEALPEIIKYFKENGYEFQTMLDAVERE